MAPKKNLTEREADEIIQSYSTTVYRLAYAQMRSTSDADDVFQEVFLRYVKKRPVFQSREHEKAWFLRVTLNCCKNAWNASNRRRTEPLDETIPAEQEPEDWLSPLIEELSPDYRAVVHLFYYEGLSTREISRLIRQKESTVRMRLTRARRLLKMKIEGENNDVE